MYAAQHLCLRVTLVLFRFPFRYLPVNLFHKGLSQLDLALIRLEDISGLLEVTLQAVNFFLFGDQSLLKLLLLPLQIE